MPDGNLMQSRARLGSRFETTSHYEVERVRKTRTYGLLDSACQLIELTETQAERAQRAYRACGFVEEGRLRQHAWGNGAYIDLVYMGILRTEWEARQS